LLSESWISAAATSSAESGMGTAALGAAAQLGATQALLPRLREQDGRVELRLSVYETATGELVAASRAEAPIDALGSACSEALARSLGISADTARHRPELDSNSVCAFACALDIAWPAEYKVNVRSF
jgi:hypothetical protein